MLHTLIWLTIGTFIGIAFVGGWVTVEQILNEIVAPLKEILWRIEDYLTR